MAQNKEKCNNCENFEQKGWRLAFLVFCIILILINLAIILMILPGSGWDFRVNISAVIAAINNLNPYNPEIISQISQIPDIPFGYPPYTLVFFYLLAIPRFFSIYYIIWTVLLFSSYYIISYLEKKDRIFLFTIMISGFLSTFWSYLTGNQGIIYLFLISLVFYFIILKREYFSSFCLGLASSFNIFPLLFSFVYIFLQKTIKDRIKIISLPFLFVGLLFSLSFLVTPNVFKQYIEMITSGIPLEGAGTDVPVAFYINTPTPYWLINQLCKFAGLQDSLIFIAGCVGYVISISGIWYLFYRSNRDNELLVISFTMIGIFLVLPRLKPYYFTFILVPIFFLTKDYSFQRKVIILFIISFIPFFLFILFRFSQNILTSFSQLWACLGVFILIFFYSGNINRYRFILP